MGATLARAPPRVALGGCGTDLPSYYREHGGFVVSTVTDRHTGLEGVPELRFGLDSRGATALER